MASRYNFDEAYSTDSCTDSEWEFICEHVGLKFASEDVKDGSEDTNNENEDIKKKKTSKDEEKLGKMKKTASKDNEKKEEKKETDRKHGKDDGKNEEKKTEKKKKRTHSKAEEKMDTEITEKKKKMTGANIQEQMDPEITEKEKDTCSNIEEKMDITESAIQSEMTETDVVSEVRKDMKSLRKNLKVGRVQLLNWNENQEEIEETYKEFKKMSKMIKKKLKGLLYKEKSREGGKNEDKNIPVDPGVVHNTGKITSASKPICSSFQGHTRYKCPSCNYMGRSVGRTYAHMVDNHNASSLSCQKCSFTTKNPTSLHNHNKLYCAKRDRK